MKKILMSFVLVSVLLVSFGVVSAEVNAVTPSTNDINRVNGWAHVDAVSDVSEVTLNFISTRAFLSCFEYRSDGDTSQMTSPTNYNPAVLDGLYPFFCQNNNNRVVSIPANEYVEVRMVFGAEGDERFDWTWFDTLFLRTAEITSPLEGEEVYGEVSFDAVLNDKDGDDSVQWAVRKGTCAAGTNTILGNVDGFNTAYDWDGATFHALTDTSTWELGSYCFIFNPTETSGDTPIRLTREFTVIDPDMDDDGVLDAEDKCLGTIADVTDVKLGVNRHVFYGGEYFTTLVPAKKGAFTEVDSEFSIVDTYGCSCEQILDNMVSATGFDFEGHYKFGCSKSILEDWIAGEDYMAPAII